MRMNKYGALAATAVLALTLSFGANATEVASPVNVRSGPGAKWPVVASIPAGADVQVLTCTTGWKWRYCQVQAGDVKGWVKEVALARNGGQVNVAGVVTTDATDLHKSAGIFSRVITTIPAGGEVNVLHCPNGLGSGWCKVAYGGAVGFVRGGLLTRNNYGAESWPF